jgi:hypothetical protein
VGEALVHHLYTYLDFTEVLEHEAVNDVALTISRGRLDLELSREERQAAYKLYVDEGYHAMFSDDLKNQVITATGIKPAVVGRPSFLRRLDAILAGAPPEMGWLVKPFFAIVSETLISGTLTRVPRDTRVVKAVRDVLKDHAADEAVHHVYFAGLLETMWPQLTDKQRRFIGEQLPEFILGFLEPDQEAILANLQAMGLTPEGAGAVFEDCYPRQEVLKGVRAASAVTVTHFWNAGVFDGSDIGEVFEKKGLELRTAIANGRNVPIDDPFGNN